MIHARDPENRQSGLPESPSASSLVDKVKSATVVPSVRWPGAFEVAYPVELSLGWLRAWQSVVIGFGIPIAIIAWIIVGVRLRQGWTDAADFPTAAMVAFVCTMAAFAAIGWHFVDRIRFVKRLQAAVVGVRVDSWASVVLMEILIVGACWGGKRRFDEERWFHAVALHRSNLTGRVPSALFINVALPRRPSEDDSMELVDLKPGGMADPIGGRKAIRGAVVAVALSLLVLLVLGRSWTIGVPVVLVATLVIWMAAARHGFRPLELNARIAELRAVRFAGVLGEDVFTPDDSIMLVQSVRRPLSLPRHSQLVLQEDRTSVEFLRRDGKSASFFVRDAEDPRLTALLLRWTGGPRGA